MMPGRRVDRVPNSPRMPSGASGLGSNVSNWLGEPQRKMKMQASAVGVTACVLPIAYVLFKRAEATMADVV